MILYDELIKFHNFNKSILYLPSLVSNLKNCKTGSFSPLGDKLVLGTDISIIFIDSYSWEIIHKVQLLNLSGTLYPEEKT